MTSSMAWTPRKTSAPRHVAQAEAAFSMVKAVAQAKIVVDTGLAGATQIVCMERSVLRSTRYLLR